MIYLNTSRKLLKKKKMAIPSVVRDVEDVRLSYAAGTI